MKRTSKNVPAGFDSWFEVDFCETCPAAKKHADQIAYVQHRTYNPDFTVNLEGGRKIYVECKGRFRDAAEARKYVDVRDSLSPSEELVFCFVASSKPMPNSSRRKCGTRYSHAEWAEKNQFRYFELNNIPEEILG